VAEWLRSGLQSRVHRFDSGRRLARNLGEGSDVTIGSSSLCFRSPRAISSAGRAPPRQGGGHWFEPSIAHSSKAPSQRGFRHSQSPSRVATIPVGELEGAIEFYVGTLGFEKRADFRYEGERWAEVAPPGAVTTLSLVAAREDKPAGIETGVGFDTEDVDADHADLLARGVDVDAAILAKEIRSCAGAAPAWRALRRCSCFAIRTATRS
jgi:hypothetical protein